MFASKKNGRSLRPHSSSTRRQLERRSTSSEQQAVALYATTQCLRKLYISKTVYEDSQNLNYKMKKEDPEKSWQKEGKRGIGQQRPTFDIYETITHETR